MALGRGARGVFARTKIKFVSPLPERWCNVGRIRTIKPDFPQSESIGRLSRDARLLFIQLWTLADDAGRLRGNPRLIASLLYPFDELSQADIDSWLRELAREGCIRMYATGGATYIEVCNFLIHQRIEKPQTSKLPAFQEDWRIVCDNSGNIPGTFPEHSPNVPGTFPDGMEWNGREGNGREGNKGCAAPSAPRRDPDKQSFPAEERKETGKPSPQVRSRGRADVTAANQTPEAPTAAAWAAYSDAYAARYGVQPLRNATTNSQMAAFVRRAGRDEAPALAAWFVSHPGVRYVQGGHTVGLLLQDAEKLRTEWVTGRVSGVMKGRQAEIEARNEEAVSRLLASVAESGGANA